jgi:hypothetical protein
MRKHCETVQGHRLRSAGCTVIQQATLLEAMPRSHTLLQRLLTYRATLQFLLSVEAQDLLLPSSIHFKIPCILEENNWSLLINGLCNTLKLAIISLYVICVLRWINILKLFLKFAEIYWLDFYREAMHPPHPCTLRPWIKEGAQQVFGFIKKTTSYRTEKMYLLYITPLVSHTYDFIFLIYLLHPRQILSFCVANHLSAAGAKSGQ